MKKIVVVQAGWVFVGDVQEKAHNDTNVVLVNASVIRQWGTTQGLGELALTGLTKETVLDPCGTAEIPGHAILWSCPVTEAAAKKFK